MKKKKQKTTNINDPVIFFKRWYFEVDKIAVKILAKGNILD